MKKVLTMTMNPCIDRTIFLETFQVGGTNIVNKVMEEAAGKGINVAVGLKHIDVPVKALGFVNKEDAWKLYQKLEKEQIPYSFVEVEGRLRINQKIFDEEKSQMTECNEKGRPVSETDLEKLLHLLEKELQEASILVVSGSVPPGVKTDIYAVMTAMAKKAGVKTILDASGKLLVEGIKEKPYLIKPNKEEFIRTFLSEQVGTEAQIEEMAEELIRKGLSYICLSAGEEGVVFFSSAKEADAMVLIEKRPAFAVPIRSLQGAGDAMVAGLCKAVYENQEDKMLDYALQMAASTIMLEGTQMGNLSAYSMYSKNAAVNIL